MNDLFIIVILIALLFIIHYNQQFDQPDQQFDQPDQFDYQTDQQFDTLLFTKVQQCLLDSAFVPAPIPPVLTGDIPSIDLEAHYRQLLKATKPFRDTKEISYAGYSGPWIERHWINHFCCNRSVMRDFGGLVPLFVQWTDMSSHTGDGWYHSIAFKRFFSMLRPNVLYVTVSQNDNGINNIRSHKFPLPTETWNIFVISAGGYGHMPIPLLIKELQVQPVPSVYPTFISFVGTMHSWSTVRHQMMKVVHDVTTRHGLIGKHYSGQEWLRVMNQSLLNLTPRGYGRSAFHIYETIQLGYIPVYIYNDHMWLPYKGSPSHLTSFGFAVHVNQFATWLDDMATKQLNVEELRTIMLKYRESHYTFKGVLQQLEYFFKQDQRCDLVCHRHPDDA